LRFVNYFTAKCAERAESSKKLGGFGVMPLNSAIALGDQQS
jgi:hypothetical protein